MDRCRVCGGSIETFMSFGRMPLANGFLRPDQFGTEFFFELRVAHCERCALVQLAEQPDRTRMFHGAYPFYSSSSQAMAAHFAALAAELIQGCGTAPDPFIVEIGSNDGTLLQHVARRGIRHLGVEPSSNVAAAAAARGIRTLVRFFDESLARRIAAADGQAQAIVATNVMCHEGELNSMFAGIHALLAPGGAFVFEDPYWGAIVDKTAFDQIYDEHALYFSVTAVDRLARGHGLTLVDVQPQRVHGGSMRYSIAHSGEPSPAVAAAIDRERMMGLHARDTLDRFRCRIDERRERLRQKLAEHKRNRRRVVGYAATSKSATVLNYCGIGPDLVEFVCDTTPAKQGLFTPGSHIPVKPAGAFAEPFPDRALLFAWNHEREIRAKEEAFCRGGGKWMVYVPDVRELTGSG